LLRTIKFASLYNAVRTYLDDKPRTIEFKWHFKERLKWEQIRIVRNHALHGWKAVATGFNERFGEYIVFEKRGFKIAIPLQRFFYIYRAESAYEQLINYNSKTIVDVGGFIGETMVLFTMWGAEVAEVYEPDPINCEVIKLNMALNNIVNTKILRKAIWRTRGDTVVGIPASRKGDHEKLTMFGVNRTSSYQFVTDTVPVKDVLDSGADVIKFDCEGCERSLLELDCNKIRKIPIYIIGLENVTSHKRDEFLEKFKKCGFKVQFVIRTAKILAQHIV